MYQRKEKVYYQEEEEEEEEKDGAWWLSGKFGGLRPEDLKFESHSSCHVGTLGKSFTHSCL